MRVLYSGTIAASQGGPAMSIYYTLHGLRQLGVNAQLLQYAVSKNDSMRGKGDIPIHYVQSVPHTPLGYAPTFKRDVEACGPQDIYHAQGIWQWNTYMMADVASKYHKPYLISTRGMLNPSDIAKHNAWAKKLSLRFRLLNDLNRAACVHVTCEEEMHHCRAVGVTSPIAIIPNPIDINGYKIAQPDQTFRVAYLGRLVPMKNVESLVYAFDSLRNDMTDAELVIIGADDARYEDFLRNEVKRLNLSNVKFTGFLTGADKNKVLESCSLLVLPSKYENFGNSVLEGLARNIPCIATIGAPWAELNTEHCGWQVPFEQDAIIDAIRMALHTPKDELWRMGENGRRLVERKYTVEMVAKEMLALYHWILGTGEKPKCVFEL